MRAHFIGIGGIGVSSLARFCLSEGWKVSGSDVSGSDLINELRDEGVRIFIGHDPKNLIGDCDLVIHTAAVHSENSEIKAASKRNIQTLTYAQAVARLTDQYFTIAISGSHGKSTTTAMLALILIKAGLDPTVIIGTKLREFNNSNFRKGNSNILVLEADEWNRSFHHYRPQMIVLTNIDNEHLDTYKNYNEVVRSFAKYVKNIGRSGVLIANWADKGIRNSIRSSRAKIHWYNKGQTKNHPLKLPGIHNQLNAQAAWQAARTLGVRKSIANEVFRHYEGSWRRLEQIGSGRLIYSDYAHHPTEIKATLQALREKHPDKKIICLFEPHQQDRLTKLFKEFLGAFRNSDHLIILPTYSVKGREYTKGKTSMDLVKNIKGAQYAVDFRSANKMIGTNNNVVVLLSAGGLDEQARKFLASPY